MERDMCNALLYSWSTWTALLYLQLLLLSRLNEYQLRAINLNSSIYPRVLRFSPTEEPRILLVEYQGSHVARLVEAASSKGSTISSWKSKRVFNKFQTKVRFALLKRWRTMRSRWYGNRFLIVISVLVPAFNKWLRRTSRSRRKGEMACQWRLMYDVLVDYYNAPREFSANL